MRLRASTFRLVSLFPPLTLTCGSWRLGLRCPIFVSICEYRSCRTVGDSMYGASLLRLCWYFDDAEAPGGAVCKRVHY